MFSTKIGVSLLGAVGVGSVVTYSIYTRTEKVADSKERDAKQMTKPISDESKGLAETTKEDIGSLKTAAQTGKTADSEGQSAGAVKTDVDSEQGEEKTISKEQGTGQLPELQHTSEDIKGKVGNDGGSVTTPLVDAQTGGDNDSEGQVLDSVAPHEISSQDTGDTTTQDQGVVQPSSDQHTNGEVKDAVENNEGSSGQGAESVETPVEVAVGSQDQDTTKKGEESSTTHTTNEQTERSGNSAGQGSGSEPTPVVAA